MDLGPYLPNGGGNLTPQSAIEFIGEDRQPLQLDAEYDLVDSKGGTNQTYKQAYRVGRYSNNHNNYLPGTILFNNLKKNEHGRADILSLASTPVINYYAEEAVRTEVEVSKDSKRRREFREAFLYIYDVKQAIQTWAIAGAVDSSLHITVRGSYSGCGTKNSSTTRPLLATQVGGLVEVFNNFGTHVRPGQQCYYIWTMVDDYFEYFYDWTGSIKRCGNQNVSMVQVLGVSDGNLNSIPWNSSDDFETPNTHDRDYIQRNKILKSTYNIIEATEDGGFVKRDTELLDVPDLLVDKMFGTGAVIKVGTTYTGSNPINESSYKLSQRSLTQLEAMPKIKIFWAD